jgi:hypothetical protein
MGWPKIKIKFPTISEVTQVLTSAEKVAAAAEVIAKAAAMLADAADAENDQLQDPVVQLFDNYEKASRVLQQRATISEPLSDGLALPTGGVTRSKSFVGLWSNPSAVEGDSPETFDMYKELSSLVAITGLPSKIEVGPGLERDTTAIIAKAIFANAPVLEDLAPDQDPTKILDFKITNHKKDCVIQVKHAFYDIPISSRTKESCWHSAIHVKMAADGQLLRAQDKNFVSDDFEDTGLNWVSTIAIEWPTLSNAEAALRSFQDVFMKQKFSDYKLDANSVLGVTQLLKIRTPEDITPAILKSKVTTIVQQMLKPGSEALVAMPDISVSGVGMTFDR